MAALEATAAPNATRATLVERSSLTAADASHMSMELHYAGRILLPAASRCWAAPGSGWPLQGPATPPFNFEISGSKSPSRLGHAIALTTF